MSAREFDLAAANGEAKQRLVTSLRGKGAHLSYEDAVRDFPARLINTRPDHVPYTFWHQLEHIRIAQLDMLRYIADPQYVSPPWPAGYWPDTHATADESAWKKTIAAYYADLEELITLIEDPSCNVLAPVSHMEDRSIMRSALVLVDHTAYHVGEFVMARQILGEWKSELSRSV